MEIGVLVLVRGEVFGEFTPPYDREQLIAASEGLEPSSAAVQGNEGVFQLTETHTTDTASTPSPAPSDPVTRDGSPPRPADRSLACGWATRRSPCCARWRCCPRSVVLVIVGSDRQPRFYHGVKPPWHRTADLLARHRRRRRGARPAHPRSWTLSLESTYGLAPMVAAWLILPKVDFGSGAEINVFLRAARLARHRRPRRHGQRAADRQRPPQRLHRHARDDDRARGPSERDPRGPGAVCCPDTLAAFGAAQVGLGSDLADRVYGVIFIIVGVFLRYHRAGRDLRGRRRPQSGPDGRECSTGSTIGCYVAASVLAGNRRPDGGRRRVCRR